MRLVVCAAAAAAITVVSPRLLADEPRRDVPAGTAPADAPHRDVPAGTAPAGRPPTSVTTGTGASYGTDPLASEGPSGGAAFFTGAVAIVLGFTVGGLLIATSNDGERQNNAGWLTIESGFALAPLASHAVTGEWGRGALFAVAPLASIAGTASLFELDPGTIVHGTLPQQRVLWSLFGVGLLSSSAGVIDAALVSARKHTTKIAFGPWVGPRQLGLQVGGCL